MPAEKKEDSKKNDTKSSENKISQFFHRLIAYGGISADPGILYVWGDPNLLIPYESFSAFEKGLLDTLGDDGKNLILWFGRISGFQSSDVLKKRFGLTFDKVWEDDHSDLDNLINGATQDGFGFFSSTTYTKSGKSLNQKITGKKCTIGTKFAELYGKQKDERDIYSSGVILGGIEFLYKVPVAIKEVQCIAKGDSECVFDFHEDKSADYFSSLFKKSTLNQKKIEDAMSSLYLKRPAKGKFVNVKNIKFGDGNFIFYEQPGVVVATRAFSPVMEIAKKLIPQKKYEELLASFAKGYVPHALRGISLKGTPLTQQVSAVIKNINLFGFGEFSILNARGNDIFIENKTNPLVRDHVSLFGFGKNSYDEVISSLLKHVFEALYKTSISVEEVECVAQGKRRCLFKITRK